MAYTNTALQICQLKAGESFLYPQNPEQAALAFYHKQQLKQLAGSNCFYVRAGVPDTLKALQTSHYVFLYSGGRRHELVFNGYYGKIRSVRKKHKLQIKGKENSQTEYYYEVKVEKAFQYNKQLCAPVNPAVLLNGITSLQSRYLARYLPSLTTLAKILSHNKLYTL